jgi:hypothetical protein
MGILSVNHPLQELYRLQDTRDDFLRDLGESHKNHKHKPVWPILMKLDTKDRITGPSEFKYTYYETPSQFNKLKAAPKKASSEVLDTRERY